MCLKTYIVQYTHSNGNGWAIINCPSPSCVENILKKQSKMLNVQVVSYSELRYFGEEMGLVYEGCITTIGQSPYDIAVANGFRGSVTEWLQSLVGPEGSKGDKGDKGDRGDAFLYSDFTEEQLNALKGPKGDTGGQGIPGEKGDKGEQGDVGPKGDTGAKGEKGDKGDKGSKGDKGDAFTYNDFTPEQLAALKGEKGDKGNPGQDGIGVPSGGLTGQVLKKKSDSNYDTEWGEVGGGGGVGNVESVNGKTGVVVLDANDVGALPSDTPLFSGDYNDLANKPTIPTVPTNVSVFDNDAGYLTEHQDISSVVDGGAYNSQTKKIELKHGSTVLAEIDAAQFIVDGMVEDVRIENENLLINFNTDSGKQDIEIPLTDIFNPDNYYTKIETDALVANLQTQVDGISDIFRVKKF